jgi:exodeoxyribonuclease VII large subunit
MFRECAGVIRLQRARLVAHERSVLHREPARMLRERGQQIDTLDSAMQLAAELAFKDRREHLRHAMAVIAAHRPAPQLAMLRDRLARVGVLIQEAAGRKISQRRERLQNAAAMLQTLSPDATLARGYSITFDAGGRVVRSVQTLKSGQVIRSHFCDGEADSVVGRLREG